MGKTDDFNSILKNLKSGKEYTVYELIERFDKEYGTEKATLLMVKMLTKGILEMKAGKISLSVSEILPLGENGSDGGA